MRNLVIGAILFIGRVGAHFVPKTTLDVFATRGLSNRKKDTFLQFYNKRHIHTLEQSSVSIVSISH